MSEPIAMRLRDLGEPLVDAWRREFDGIATVTISCGDIFCPGIGTAVGRMPVHRCARQMRVAWDRVLGDGQTSPRSLHDISADELDLLR